MNPSGEAVARFAADLAALRPGEGPLGIAVSGGPDSLALLLLAAAARLGKVEAATVDHGLRSESADEAKVVAAICARIGIPHAVLKVEWDERPAANLQARAREARYERLAQWARERAIGTIATAHHADDQAETLLMRLARGAGLRGLAGIRPRRRLDDAVTVVRPLLNWRRAELAEIVAAAGLVAVDDASNRDPRHDRTRVRAGLGRPGAPDPLRLAAVAGHLREADDAIEWALRSLVRTRLARDGAAIMVDAENIPSELQRRLLLAAFTGLDAPWPSGPDLGRALAALRDGRTATLGGIKLESGPPWRLSPAPPHRGRPRRA